LSLLLFQHDFSHLFEFFLFLYDLHFNKMSKIHTSRSSSPPPAYTERSPLIQRDAVEDVEAFSTIPTRQIIWRDIIMTFISYMFVLTCSLGLLLLLIAGWNAWFASPPTAPAPTVREVSIAVIGAGYVHIISFFVQDLTG